MVISWRRGVSPPRLPLKAAEGASMAQAAIGEAACVVGEVLLRRDQPRQALCLMWVRQLLLTPFASFLLLPACHSLPNDPHSVDG